MKPKTLARHALKMVESGLFEFDCLERKKEAIKQMKSIIKDKNATIDFDDTIIEIHIGVYIPNFDYPIIPIDENGIPIVWEEDGEFNVPGPGTHTVKGIGLSGEKYYLSYMSSLAAFRDCDIKVDRYTDVERAAYALVCCVTHIINKNSIYFNDKFKSYNIPTNVPLTLDFQHVIDDWNNISHNRDKEFEEQQHKLYIKWLQRWINIHGKNPETHMKVLKSTKKVDEITFS